jgi:uncharacterized protein (DUF2267 family)
MRIAAQAEGRLTGLFSHDAWARARRDIDTEENLMSATGLSTFDSTLQITNIWLNDVADRLGTPDRHRAYHALRAVLHAVRDRLPVDEAAALGAQLPLLIRGVYYDGWHPAGKPLKDRHKAEFLAHIERDYEREGNVDVDAVTRKVLQVIARHVSPGEINHIVRIMPPEIAELWDTAPRRDW